MKSVLFASLSDSDETDAGDGETSAVGTLDIGVAVFPDIGAPVRENSLEGEESGIAGDEGVDKADVAEPASPPSRTEQEDDNRQRTSSKRIKRRLVFFHNIPLSVISESRLLLQTRN